MTLGLCSRIDRSLPTLFDAIDGPCSGPALRRRLNADAVDSDCASGLVGSLVINVVKLAFSLRRLRLAEELRAFRSTLRASVYILIMVMM